MMGYKTVGLFLLTAFVAGMTGWAKASGFGPYGTLGTSLFSLGFGVGLWLGTRSRSEVGFVAGGVIGAGLGCSIGVMISIVVAMVGSPYYQPFGVGETLIMLLVGGITSGLGGATLAFLYCAFRAPLPTIRNVVSDDQIAHYDR